MLTYEVVVGVGVTVASRLGEHVSEVQTLAEHVTARGCLRWGNAQTLVENTDVVTQTRTVPQQLARSGILEGPVFGG